MDAAYLWPLSEQPPKRLLPSLSLVRRRRGEDETPFSSAGVIMNRWPLENLMFYEGRKICQVTGSSNVLIPRRLFHETIYPQNARKVYLAFSANLQKNYCELYVEDEASGIVRSRALDGGNNRLRDVSHVTRRLNAIRGDLE